MIWPDTVNGISDIELSEDGHTATGVVEFEAPGCFHGHVPFVAHRDGGQWRVDEFVMPEIGWRVVRGMSGLWTTEPIAAPGRRRSASEIWDQAGRTTPLGEDPAVVSILTGGNLAIRAGSSEWKPLAGPGLEIGGRRVVVDSRARHHRRRPAGGPRASSVGETATAFVRACRPASDEGAHRPADANRTARARHGRRACASALRHRPIPVFLCRTDGVPGVDRQGDPPFSQHRRRSVRLRGTR